MLAALFTIAILFITALAIFLGGFGFDFTILGFSIYTLLIIVLYFIAQKKIFDVGEPSDVIPGENYTEHKLKSAVIGFVLLGLLVVAAGSWLPFIGGEIPL